MGHAGRVRLAGFSYTTSLAQRHPCYDPKVLLTRRVEQLNRNIPLKAARDQKSKWHTEQTMVVPVRTMAERRLYIFLDLGRVKVDVESQQSQGGHDGACGTHSGALEMSGGVARRRCFGGR